MTAIQLITALGNRGIEISRKTLFTYRAADPGKPPEGFDAVDDWARFILERRIYEPGRTQAPEKREAKERTAMNRHRRRQVSRSLPHGDSDAEEYSAAVERRERIIKLRLANEVRRSSLEQLRQSTITIAECVETLDGIKRVVGAALLRLPASLCHDLANREPRYIQQVLDAALRSSLERLIRLENYLCSKL
jgi:hypothetical protein